MKATVVPQFLGETVTDFQDQKPSLRHLVLSSSQAHSGPISESHPLLGDSTFFGYLLLPLEISLEKQNGENPSFSAYPSPCN